MRSARFDGAAAIAAAIVFLAVLAIGLWQIYRSHPAEDAFILFKYVENLAAGNGIVYFAGGARTEGATDFLWMILLAGGVWAGADVAVTALFWNALGAAVCAALLAREIAAAGVPRPWRLALFVVPLSIPLLAGAPAAYLGFSSLAYQGLVLAAFVVASAAPAGALGTVPWLGLTLSLFRPDGVFLGGAFALAALVRAWGGPGWRSFVRSSAAALVAGIAYFLGRWWYFGLPLPLPLYVKNHGVVHGPLADQILHYAPWMKGIGVHFMWMKTAIGPVPWIVTLVVLLATSSREGRVGAEWKRKAGIAALAAVSFLGALSLAFQVQNVHFRYQAPTTLFLIFLVTGLAAERLAHARAALSRLAILAALLTGLSPGLTGGLFAIRQSVAGRSYIDVFPARLAAVLAPQRTIALTDAGRLGYWWRGRTIDVAGLNYAPTALRPPSVASLRKIDPDVLLLHPGAGVIGEAFAPPSGSPPYWELDAASIDRQISPVHRPIFEHGLAQYLPDSNTATVAALVMLGYLAERADDYVILAVRYQGGYRHVLAFRRTLPEAASIRRALEETTSGRPYFSYAALKGFPLAAPAEASTDRSEQ